MNDLLFFNKCKDILNGLSINIPLFKSKSEIQINISFIHSGRFLVKENIGKKKIGLYIIH